MEVAAKGIASVTQRTTAAPKMSWHLLAREILMNCDKNTTVCLIVVMAMLAIKDITWDMKRRVR